VDINLITSTPHRYHVESSNKPDVEASKGEHISVNGSASNADHPRGIGKKRRGAKNKGVLSKSALFTLYHYICWLSFPALS